MKFGFHAADPKFYDLIDVNAEFESVSTGHSVTEGIIWWPQKRLIVFSDMWAGKVYTWNPETFETKVIKSPSNITNGNAIDRDGNIVQVEHATNRVVRMMPDGRWLKTLADSYEGKALNSPNDIIVDKKGRIWFSDPTYGHISKVAGIPRPCELDFQGVYCIDTDGKLILANKDFDQPNGLCVEIGEETMLVNDTVRNNIRRYKIEDDCTLTGGELVCETPTPDGTKIDKDGNIYTTFNTGAGIRIFTKEGKHLGDITVPGNCRNFCFGMDNMDYLFFACDTIYRLKIKTQGYNVYE